MEEAQAVDAGVNAGAEAPTPDEATPASESTESQGDNGSERSHGSAQSRIQKLANENRQHRERAERLEREMGSLQGARDLHMLLQRDPRKAREVMDLLEGRNQPQNPQKDPFDEYEPIEAEALRAAMEFKQWKAQQEQWQQQNYHQSIIENNQNLESLFEQRLMKDGFVDKDGSYDEKAVKTIAGAVLTTAMDVARDPNRITEKEMSAAYEAVMDGIKSLEKRALKSTVRSTPPPPSNSHRGTIPVGRTKESDEQRLARIVKEFDQARA